MHNAFFVCADNDFTLRFLHRLAVTATLNIFSLLDTVKNDRREDVPTRADVADQCKYILENKRKTERESKSEIFDTMEEL